MCGILEEQEYRKDTWTHKVTMVNEHIIHVDGVHRAVAMVADEVKIGCTTVAREVIEKLAADFKVYFPDNKAREVKIQ
jgi:hypothetical protein